MLVAETELAPVARLKIKRLKTRLSDFLAGGEEATAKAKSL